MERAIDTHRIWCGILLEDLSLGSWSLTLELLTISGSVVLLILHNNITQTALKTFTKTGI